LIAPGEKTKRAETVGEFMSWQLTTEMKGWVTETDALLHQIPVVGGAVKDTYYDRSTGKNVSHHISLLNMVWSYNAKSFEAAPRHTEKFWSYPHEIMKLERSEQNEQGEGLWLHYIYGPGGDPRAGDGAVDQNGGQESQQSSTDTAAPHFFLRQHMRW